MSSGIAHYKLSRFAEDRILICMELTEVQGLILPPVESLENLTALVLLGWL